VRDTANHGHAVLFISHDLGEVLEFADTATVLRDGRVVGNRDTKALAPDDLFELIVGRPRDEVVPATAAPADAETLVRAEAVGVPSAGRSSFAVAAGAILGLTGLLGSGFEEVPHILFGARRGEGRLVVGRDALDLHGLRPRAAMAKGVALVPADRLGAGVIATLSIGENIAMLQLPRFTRRWTLLWRRLRGYARDVIGRYRIVAHSDADDVLTLSGGNQQRVLLSKWLETSPRLLLLHEPVQGVDVGARIDITRLIRAHAQQGVAIVSASSDYEFLSELCDRVLVYRNGAVVEELTRPSPDTPISRERIEWACLSTGATTVVIEDDAAVAGET
jgi:ribose transport system ATP-binding protein